MPKNAQLAYHLNDTESQQDLGDLILLQLDGIVRALTAHQHLPKNHMRHQFLHMIV